MKFYVIDAGLLRETLFKQHVTDSQIVSIDYLPSKQLFLFYDSDYGISVYKMK